MAASHEYKVRPSSRTDLKDIFKILLSSANLLQKIKPGDVCNIETSQGLVGPAIAWNASEKIKDDIVQTSKALQKLYGLKLDNRISISPSNGSIVNTSDITLREVTQDGSFVLESSLGETDRLAWALLLKFSLRKADIVTPGIVLDAVDPQGEKRSFRIHQVNLSKNPVLYRAQSNCEIRITDATPQDDKHYKLFVSSDGVGGLSSQMTQINRKIRAFRGPLDSRSHLADFFRPCGNAIILHGLSGTGKSLVLRKISEAGWRKVFHVDSTVLDPGIDVAKAALAQIFSDALKCQPSVIIIDCLDSIAGQKDTQDSGLSASMGFFLSQQLDRLGDSRTLAVGAARRLTDIDQDLRGAGRFEREIEMPIPDSKSRAEILKVFVKLPLDRDHATLDSIAARTHGFVGADLKKLLGQAVDGYWTTNADLIERDGEDRKRKKVEPEVLISEMDGDFNNALSHVHPTAMQEIFVEVPNVRWADIGGQHKVKKKLEQAVVWPTKYAEDMKEHGVEPKKGLLMYGPPGCSKTMIAKAAATESGLNFIVVRGPELVKMYVGESERALREVFSKARVVRPSIIFFDEIDAIGATAAAGQHGGVQTVTTLLNELDGFHAMEGVFVLAATNRPEILDPALIRAGRLDETSYVGLPDVEARRDILRMNMRTMKLAHDIDEDTLAKATEGFSGAELVQICQNARLATVEEQIESQESRSVSQRHFNSALSDAEKSVTSEMMQRYKAWGACRR